jgi:hypothetical protein
MDFCVWKSYALRRMKTLSCAALGILLFLAACHQSKPPVDLSRVSVGMTKQEAIEQLGRPDKVAVNRGVEYLQYEAYDDSVWDWEGRRNYRWFFVRIVDGHVDTFGDKGDFDSTKDPTVHVKVDQRIDQTTTTKTADPDDSETKPPPRVKNHDKFDLAAELKHLDQMKTDGLLTDAEYADLRKSAIDKAK